MYKCSYPIPADGTLEGYTKLKNSTCTFCAEKCKPPTINDSIAFFDGCKSSAVWIGFGVLIGFTILWQIYQFACVRPKVNKEYEKLVNQKHFTGLTGKPNMHSPNTTMLQDTSYISYMKGDNSFNTSFGNKSNKLHTTDSDNLVNAYK